MIRPIGNGGQRKPWLGGMWDAIVRSERPKPKPPKTPKK